METNEPMKTTLVQEAEAEVVKLLKVVQELKVGDLKRVEQEVLASLFALGRKTLERIMQGQPETEEAPARREGACGHEQRLVGMRPKQVLTLLGAITMQRAYYQCRIPPDDQKQEGSPPCTHGEAPADTLWGIGQRRTSAGVQQQVSYLCASLTLEEAAAAFSRLFPLQMSARQALYLMQPVGEALAAAERAQVNALWKEAAKTHTTPDSSSRPSDEEIDRLYIQLDGVLARLRRGSVPEQAIGYFTTNAERMRYPQFRSQGLQIGSGIAEAACKTVVSTRTKRAGMRWTPAGLDALLPLRTAVLNGSFDAFWLGRSHALV